MRIEERQRAIVALVNERGSVSFADIQENFPDVSGMTLRRDLEALDRENKLVRIHGGAKSVKCLMRRPEADYRMRSVDNVEKKRAIAKTAVSLLKTGKSVYIDSGTTAVEFCKAFPDEQMLIYTHGLDCGLELSRLENPEIHLLGGRLSRVSLSIVGASAVHFLDNINFDIVFLSASGYSASRGFTCNGAEESYLRKEIIQRAEKIVMLVDSSKFSKLTSYTVANLEDVDVVITDDGIDEKTFQEFKAQNIEVIICPTAE